MPWLFVPLMLFCCIDALRSARSRRRGEEQQREGRAWADITRGVGFLLTGITYLWMWRLNESPASLALGIIAGFMMVVGTFFNLFLRFKSFLREMKTHLDADKQCNE